MGDINLSQSGTGNYQAGRDIVIPVPEDDISEPEFKIIINKFMVGKTSVPGEDLTIIELSEKNILNELSDQAFYHIKKSSVVSYDKLDALLKEPTNEDLREFYENLVFSLQTQYVHSNMCGNIERFFRKTYQMFIKNDVSLKERNWGLQLVYFMYLRCDLGLK
ncbi:MAG: hypothetical protein JNL74_02155 [Fibrobacteres bacterium]|nr:hypothetical protein [Fibrobacterota bacterium]